MKGERGEFISMQADVGLGPCLGMLPHIHASPGSAPRCPIGAGGRGQVSAVARCAHRLLPAVQDGLRTEQPTVPSPQGAGQTPDSALGLHSILWSAKGMNPGGRARVRRDVPLLSHVLGWPACCGGQAPISSAPPYPYHTGSPTMASWLLLISHVFFWGKKLFSIQRQR